MFYAMCFIKNEWGLFNVRPIRTKGYVNLISAKKALEKSGLQGYVKKQGSKEPIWSN